MIITLSYQGAGPRRSPSCSEGMCMLCKDTPRGGGHGCGGPAAGTCRPISHLRSIQTQHGRATRAVRHSHLACTEFIAYATITAIVLVAVCLGHIGCARCTAFLSGPSTRSAWLHCTRHLLLSLRLCWRKCRHHHQRQRCRKHGGCATRHQQQRGPVTLRQHATQSVNCKVLSDNQSMIPHDYDIHTI